MKRKSNHSHSFSNIPQANIPRSVFDRSHTHKTTLDAGYLVPHYMDEVLPGDSFKLKHSIYLRATNPLSQPVMDNLYMDTFYFFVPYRLVWENWQKMMGEQEDPGDSTDYMIPVINEVTPITAGEVFDYLGVPIGKSYTQFSALYVRAYHLIFNEWFRSQDLQNSEIVPKDDGPDDSQWYSLLKRTKRHDYFTSCLPYPQKTEDGIDLPLGDSAPVIGTGDALGLTSNGTGTDAYLGNRFTSTPGDFKGFVASGLNATTLPQTTVTNQQTDEAAYGVTPIAATSGLTADLTQATAASINSLRLAFQLQKMLERDARGGTRYTEIIRSHFGVISPDARLQRPEYLGGGSNRININPVVQTSTLTDDPATTPQGNVAAYVQGINTRDGFTKSFTEHGLIIGLCNIRADLTYQQGQHKMLSRRERYDFYFPSLAHLGEQEVLNKEIYFTGSQSATDDEVFGYQERWSEYRYGNNRISGHLRSSAGTPLDSWHFAENFASCPVLSSTFIEDQSDTVFNRVSAIQDEPQFVMDCYFDLKCARPMPTYSIPGYIDHF